jgi:competence ComEA-like helix-hairpin-helix protein
MKNLLFITLALSLFLNAQSDTSSVKAAMDADLKAYKSSLQALPDSVYQPVLQKININKANVNQFASLPGIGVKTASKIIAFRESLPDKKFTFKSQLLEVKGIGRKKLEQIWIYITL